MLYLITLSAAFILALYLLLNIAYSFSLKYLAVLDVLLVASFYVLRILSGGFAANVHVSSWLIVTILFVALLLILGKRKSELGHERPREVLRHYSETFLNAALSIAAALTIIAYSLYILIAHPNPYGVYTIFFVLLGILRYLLLLYNGANAEAPERMVWRDPVILLSIVLWVITMYFIFYVVPV
jgi:4-hydroxybenzoate polyprenyltransferase